MSDWDTFMRPITRVYMTFLNVTLLCGSGWGSLQEKWVTSELTVNHPASSAILSFECNMAAVRRGFCSTYNHYECPSLTPLSFVSFVSRAQNGNQVHLSHTQYRSLLQNPNTPLSPTPPCCALIPRVGCPDSCWDRGVKSRVSLGEFSVALMYYVIFFLTHIKNPYDFADVSVELAS